MVGVDTLLLLLALTLQTADGVNTCRGLERGGRELNPVLGQSCFRLAAVKAAVFLPVPILSRPARRLYLGALATAGGVGFTVTWAINRRRD